MPVNEPSLKKKAVTAVLWSGMDIFARQAFQLVFSIILARLLSPEDFGTIALLSLFTGLASVFVDGGFVGALVQRQNVTLADESTVFWFNLAMGALMALALWAVAPLIAVFYAQPILVPLTALLALNVFLSALGSVQNTILIKALRFKVLMKVTGSAAVLSGLVGAAMAWHGYGPWALAGQTLASTIVTTGLLWYVSKWRPALVFSLSSARQMFGFGSSLLVTALLEVVYSRAYSLLIGKVFGIRELGLYSRADNTQMLPVGILTLVVNRVAFPFFSSIAQNKVQLLKAARMSVRGLMLLCVPMALGLVAVAEPLIAALFGPRWLPVAPIMQVLCLSGLLWPLNAINGNLLLSQGHSPVFLRLELVKKVCGLALLLGGAFFGLMGIAWGQVILSVLSFALAAHYSKRYLGYGAGEQIRDFLPVVAISLPMLLGVYWAGTLLHAGPVVALLSLTLLGAAIFFALAWLCRLAALHDVVELLRRRKVAAA